MGTVVGKGPASSRWVVEYERFVAVVPGQVYDEDDPVVREHPDAFCVPGDAKGAQNFPGGERVESVRLGGQPGVQTAAKRGPGRPRKLQ